jgi:trk system potassium uptake protein TrkA
VELNERDAARCERLAQELPRVHVIQGDGTSIALLRDLQVGNADHLLAVTRSDEANLMVSLLANNLGVASTSAIVHRHGYADVYGHLGVHGTAGPHEVITHAVRSLLPNDGVLRRERLPECSHELVELSLELSAASVSLDDLVLPPACMVVGISNADGFRAPAPGSALTTGMHLLIAEPAHAHRDVVKRVRELERSAR